MRRLLAAVVSPNSGSRMLIGKRLRIKLSPFITLTTILSESRAPFHKIIQTGNATPQSFAGGGIPIQTSTTRG